MSNEDDSHLLHVGAGYSLADPGNGTVRYAIQPGFFVRDPAGDGTDPGGIPVFQDTGDIPANQVNLFNIEMGANIGKLHIASEYRWSLVDQMGGPHLVFPGYYIQAGWILTGEQHSYERERGIFRRIVPLRPFELGRGGGAWELTAGLSDLDLNSRNIAGGRGQVLAVGANWYTGPFARFQFNVISAHIDAPGFGDTRTVIAEIRAQVEF